MTPPAIPPRPVERLEELRLLEAGARLRYAGRPATVLAVSDAALRLFGTPLVLLELLFDDADAPEPVVASLEKLRSFELLPAPRIYETENRP